MSFLGCSALKCLFFSNSVPDAGIFANFKKRKLERTGAMERNAKVVASTGRIRMLNEISKMSRNAKK